MSKKNVGDNGKDGDPTSQNANMAQVAFTH